MIIQSAVGLSTESTERTESTSENDSQNDSENDSENDSDSGEENSKIDPEVRFSFFYFFYISPIYSQ